MGNKGRNRRDANEDDLSDEAVSARFIIVGAVVLVVAVILGSIIGTVLLVGVDEDDPIDAAVPDFIADAPDIERSSVADLLESTSFEDMTLEQREAAFEEFTSVLANAEFRMKSPLNLGIDVVRRDGTTVITRQYGVTEAPGGEAHTDQTTFYCPGAEGAIDVYQSTRTGPAGTTVSYNRIEAGAQPLERALTSVDLSKVTDLGTMDIGGRSARGVRFVYIVSATERRDTEAWFDIENGRLLSYQQFDSKGIPSVVVDYDFDWRVPPRIEPDPELSMPPCYDEIYD